MKKRIFCLTVILLLSIIFNACGLAPLPGTGTTTAGQPASAATSDAVTASVTVTAAEEPAVTTDGLYASLPEYSSSPWVAVGDGASGFGDEVTTVSFEEYYPLDSLGRCTVAFACLGPDLMPTAKRGDISSVRPSGWQTAIYDFVDGGSLYNRCHLIGWQLSGEDANERNLITGTRYMNTAGMLPFENMAADYIKETGGHVMYRVTPYFHGEELVCRGVFMEAFSVEDEGEEVDYHVFCYNVQPGVEIDYSDGSSVPTVPQTYVTEAFYILNRNTKKFHRPDCEGVKDISEKNRAEYKGSRSALIERGYSPCGRCRP